MNDRSISIMGCGWLGLPLARRFTQLGYTVKGSTTSQEKVSALEGFGIEPYCLKASPSLAGKNATEFFQSKLLLLNIPFRRTLQDPHFYRQQIDSVIDFIVQSPVESVVFASSTSIYPPTLKLAQEEEVIVPANDRAETLLGVERALSGNAHFQTTILRFSGLYGGNRKIGKFMADKKNCSDGDSPVNLVHLEDCIEITTQTILKNISGEVINVVSDHHPSRRELYTKAAQQYGLNPPEFNDQPTERQKIVSNTKLKNILQYTFIHPDPMVF